MIHPYQYVTAKEALSIIESNTRVFIHGSVCTPIYLLNELVKECNRLQQVELVSITLKGDLEIVKPAYSNCFHMNSLFVSAPIRAAVAEGRADFVPVFLSDIPYLFKSKLLELDTAIVQVSPPDAHGYCSLGLSVDIARAAVDNAKQTIALVNPAMPRTHGDGMIHTDHFTKMVFHESALLEESYSTKVGNTELMIGKHIAEMIEDGSTLQMGIGTIPDAVLSFLSNHKNLGVHTEMLSDGIIDLVEKDVINNKFKARHPNKTVTSFAIGSKKLYDYVNDNSSFNFLDIAYVNNPHVIRQNPKAVAINSAIEVDITGQVCADSIGDKQYSGIGGQMDFMRGSALSVGGKPIIALNSRTAKGIPRIVPHLKEGAGVVTTRGHVHYVVTEYGVAYLFGKNLRQRAKLLIDIAHPDDREGLMKYCFERFKVFIPG
ncbi:MAG: acetyl-CoA hydrolase/transferase C-terminal domain-containing protein [Ferruginibacter sp.]|nr:acetyl-CoA hydrolase/transferase family protein [Bacteroidota bacterium]MBX2919487.1 acetyl-CoA hydrolase/transferase family protein [Ferruginibacter sp.]MCC7379824.1 acetyl-CoA hydrolase/transferase family protein [Chitinophagaceae bacterium]